MKRKQLFSFGLICSLTMYSASVPVWAVEGPVQIAGGGRKRSV